MKNISWLCLLILCLTTAINAGVADAADSAVSISSETARSRYRIGDIIEMSLIADVPDGTRVEFPGDSLDLQPFAILSRRLKTPEKRDGGSREVLVLNLSIYQTGEFEIPGIEVRWELPDGSTGSASTEPLFVRVDSMLNPDEKEPRQIKPLMDVPARNRYIALILAGIVLVVALMAASIYLLRKIRRHRIDETAQAIEPSRPSDEVALEALMELKGSRLLAGREVRAYFIRLSEILKIYIGHRFAFNAPEHTTGEIRRDLRCVKIDPSMQSSILHVLELSDMAKFARYVPPDDHCRSALKDVENIVLQTRDMQRRDSSEETVTKETQTS